MEEWKIYKLKEIGEIVGGATPSTKNPSNYDGPIPWITPKDLSNSNERYIFNGERSITNDGYMSCSCKLLPKGTVLFSSRAPIGYVAIAAVPMCTNQGFKSFIPNSKVDSLFMFYLMKYRKDDIANLGSGTTFIEVSGSVMKEFEVKVPNLDTQKRIANVLSSLDDKIELNNRINHNLEEQAQALYKSWFVDFEPFKDGKFVESELGMIPEGWRYDYIGKLPIYISDYVSNGSFASLKANVKLHNVKEYAHFIRNTDLKSETFPIYVDCHSYEFLSKSQLSGGEIIISNVGDVGSVYICPTLDGPMTLGNNVIMIKPDNELLKYYLYILFKWFEGKQLLKGITGGSAMPKFNKTDFKSLQILIPSTDVLMAFNAAIKPLFNEINTNSSTTQKLSKLRDTILPKLMSGELKINEIDC